MEDLSDYAEDIFQEITGEITLYDLFENILQQENPKLLKAIEEELHTQALEEAEERRRERSMDLYESYKEDMYTR